MNYAEDEVTKARDKKSIEELEADVAYFSKRLSDRVLEGDVKMSAPLKTVLAVIEEQLKKEKKLYDKAYGDKADSVLFT